MSEKEKKIFVVTKDSTPNDIVTAFVLIASNPDYLSDAAAKVTKFVLANKDGIPPRTGIKDLEVNNSDGSSDDVTNWGGG